MSSRSFVGSLLCVLCLCLLSGLANYCWLAGSLAFSLAFAFVCLQLTQPESQSGDKFLVKFAILDIQIQCFFASWHLALVDPRPFLQPCCLAALHVPEVQVLGTHGRCVGATGLGSGVAECARFWAKFHSSLSKIERINWNQCFPMLKTLALCPSFEACHSDPWFFNTKGRKLYYVPGQ